MRRQQVHPNSISARAAAVSGFACTYSSRGMDSARMHLNGELDLATAPQLERALLEPQARLVVLDLRELSFMDVAGVHAIVDASLRARRLGGRLVLLHPSPSVDRILTLTGSYQHVETGDLQPV